MRGSGSGSFWSQISPLGQATDILNGIAEPGSIAAAGRCTGMSYRRAWLMVETMNRCFNVPLVETRRGGRTRGGAVLTAMGREVLDRCRRMELLTMTAIAAETRTVRSLLADAPERK